MQIQEQHEIEELRAGWEKVQIAGAPQVSQFDIPDIDTVRYIGGLDISFDKSSNSRACAYLTVWDLQTSQVVYEDYIVCNLSIPYISGFLGFREIPQYTKLLDKMKSDPTLSKLFPQVLMIDGAGVLHERKFGCACQIGTQYDIPTIGVAKTLMCVDGLNERQVKQDFVNNCKTKSDSIELVGQSGYVYGLALKTALNVINPLYISVGHKISLGTAKKLVLSTCIYKNPEPIRNSDIKSKLYL
mgnify:CR=1 FL=1